MPARTAKRIYWDTRVWVALIDADQDPERHRIARGIYSDANQGLLEIVTSALTRAECRKLLGKRSLTQDQQDRISRYFYPDFVIRASLDWDIAEQAALFRERYSLRPEDAVHLATAADPRYKVQVFQSWDSDFFAPSVLRNSPPLPIEEPTPGATAAPADRSGQGGAR